MWNVTENPFPLPWNIDKNNHTLINEEREPHLKKEKLYRPRPQITILTRVKLYIRIETTNI